MNIQDRRKTLTVEELRRRYNLDALDKDRKAIKLQKEQLTKVDTELNNFVETTTKSIEELQNQVDGNITTWFFNGVPTVETEPTSNWITDADKNNHLGDLYYDQNTGYAYRFYLDGETNEYGWMQVIDSDVAEALAIANAAQDTADSKRRVFVVQPTPPYDIGDIWIKEDTDLYRCRASRSEGNFNTADWIRATNYTDDTVALGTKAELDQFKTQVTENYVSNATLETTVNSITSRVEETYTYTTMVENQVVDITQTTNTVEAENNFYITDSLESDAIEYTIEGKSEQNETPTPPPPAEIKTIPSIKNEFNPRESFTSNGITVTKNQDDSLSVKGTATATFNLPLMKESFYPEINQTYTISNKLVSGALNKNLWFWNASDSNSNIVINANTSKTFSFTAEKRLSSFSITVNSGDILDFTIKIMLEKGSIAHAPIPCGSWLMVNIANEDKTQEKEILFDLSKPNLFKKEDFSYNLEGYLNDNGELQSSTLTNYTQMYIPVEPNTVYTIDGFEFLNGYSQSSVSRIYFFDKDKNFISRYPSSVITSNALTFTTPENAKYIDFQFSRANNDYFINNNLKNFRLYEGYTDYYELASIDEKDTLELVTGILTKRIGKVVFDGSDDEVWNVNNANDDYKQFYISNSFGAVSGKGLSDKFEYDLYHVDKGNRFYISGVNFVFVHPIFENTDITTISKWREVLSKNPVTVWFEMSESQEIILPNTNIPLFDGVNHITLVDDLETTTSIKYYRNTPIAQDYVIQQQLDETNSNLSTTTDKTNQNASDINATNTNLNNNYYNKDQIDVMNTSTQEIVTQIKNTVETTTTATNLQIAVLQQQLVNGATKVDTGTGYTFDINGLKIQKTNSEMSSLLDNDGLVVKRNETEVLTVRSSGVETENLTVRTYFTIGDNTRVENYKNGTGFFYIGGAN